MERKFVQSFHRPGVRRVVMRNLSDELLDFGPCFAARRFDNGYVALIRSGKDCVEVFDIFGRPVAISGTLEDAYFFKEEYALLKRSNDCWRLYCLNNLEKDIYAGRDVSLLGKQYIAFRYNRGSTWKVLFLGGYCKVATVLETDAEELILYNERKYSKRMVISCSQKEGTDNTIYVISDLFCDVSCVLPHTLYIPDGNFFCSFTQWQKSFLNDDCSVALYCFKNPVVIYDRNAEKVAESVKGVIMLQSGLLVASEDMQEWQTCSERQTRVTFHHLDSQGIFLPMDKLKSRMSGFVLGNQTYLFEKSVCHSYPAMLDEIIVL